MIKSVIEESKCLQGDTYSRQIKLLAHNSEGVEVPIDIANTFASIKLELRRGARKDYPVELLRSWPGGDLVVQDQNVLVFEFLQSETQNLEGTYRYELQLTYPDGSVETWLRGYLTFEADITL